MNKNYEQKPLGFDRTQLFKEYTQPITNRQSALKAALTLMTSNNLSWSMKDIMLVTERIQNWMETGDDSFVPKMDKYFKLKSDQQLEELFSQHTKQKLDLL